ncbi:threonyl-tRNA synthetase [Planoprotostelium fungivorum]|uniref:threonine--tRNA ligase n=1 Tax=Planoprotostelium fungivorum TaxID=1890364 RepID=A0A2P6N5M2_9EUKA|nr:threonyl-tRNA synthetase [Planoprotostelium fungivorum]
MSSAEEQVPAQKPEETKPAAPEQEKKGKQPAPKKEGGAKKDVKKKANNVAENKPLPEFVAHREALWTQIKAESDARRAALPDEPIKITLPNGTVVPGIKGKTTAMEVATGLSHGWRDTLVVSKVNGVLYDVLVPIEEDCSLELFKFDSPEGKKVFWHSSAHIMGEALERLYGVKLCTGPALEEGFYYDSFMDGSISTEDFPTITAMVNKIISEKQSFERLTVTKEQALEMFKYNEFKSRILAEKVIDPTCTVYRSGTLCDPCKGPHLPNTSRIKGFLITKNSSAYWQGKADQEPLQRIYGISFPKADQLKEWQAFQEMAAKRDHRILGKAQELFFFHPLSPGSCFFLPHGTRIYNKLMNVIRQEYRDRGFHEVITPNTYNTKLWETSGHWQNYQENMFSFKCEDQTFALKPMNCPGHCLMFGHRARSYREMPIRMADFGVLHRNELSGALTGLTRVRRFQQDDAHIFCTNDQIKQEIDSALKFMEHIYGVFGFEFSLELSTRPEKFLGEIEVWNKAEASLKEVLDSMTERTGRKWKLNPGDGAFYGPKIDIHISDALKRSFQCATIQLDYQLPQRFELEYQDVNEAATRPVIIHRAILGSVERFLAILVEHTGGKWPLWISPRQIMVIPVHNKYNDYAEEVVKKKLHDAGFYVEADLSDKTMNMKIRLAQEAQYNYQLVVGEEEAAAGTVSVRDRENKQQGKPTLDDFIAKLLDDCKNWK